MKTIEKLMSERKYGDLVRLSNETGISTRTLHFIVEGATKKPQLQVLYNLSKAFDLDLSSLLLEYGWIKEK